LIRISSLSQLVGKNKKVLKGTKNGNCDQAVTSRQSIKN
jgi:hypothetical protein